MTAAPAVLASVIAATLWLSGLLAVSVRRHVPLSALLAALASFSVAHGAVVGRLVGPSDVPWDALWLASFLLGHAGIAAFLVTMFPSGRPRFRGAAIAGIAVFGGGLSVAGAAAGWESSDAFQPPTDVGLYALNAYPVVCLAVALAESLAAWKQSSHRRREASLVFVGLIVLVVGGPVYGFELSVLGLTDFVGTNLAVPVAGVLFALALWRANPLAFRGRPAPSPEIPWELASGAYLLDEARPTYAEAAFLAATGSQPALAIASSAGRRPELAGVETVWLPPGERCASVLAATASEFLSRHPRGAVLIDDASYAVVHCGLATVDAIRSIIRAMPKGASLVVSLQKLTHEERQAFRTLSGSWISPPEFYIALAAILRARLGTSDLLPRAARMWGKRPQDLAVSEVPALLDYVRAVLQELRAPSDRAAEPGWAQVSEDLGADLERFWRTPPTQMMARTIMTAAAAFEGLGIVKASSVSEVVDSVMEKEPQPPLGEAIREAFVASLGPAGDPVFRRVLRKLRKETSAIDAEDLSKVARLADEVIADFGGALDVVDAGQDLVARARRLQARLAGLAGEAR